ncbi:cilia- and flagella-associated protein 184 [Pelodytes ibericus]
MESPAADFNSDGSPFIPDTQEQPGSQEPQSPVTGMRDESLTLEAAQYDHRDKGDREVGIGQDQGLSPAKEGDQESSPREEDGTDPITVDLIDKESGIGEEGDTEMGMVSAENASSQKKGMEDTTGSILEENDSDEGKDTNTPVLTANITEECEVPIAELEGDIIITPDEEETEEYQETENKGQEEEDDGNTLMLPDVESAIDEEEEEIRENLIQQYLALVSEREKIQQQNSQLQNKLYEYFRRKKGDDTRPEIEKHVSDQDQRYLKYLSTLEEMRKKYATDAALHQQQIEELKSQCQEVVGQVNKEWQAFQDHKKKITLYGPRGAGKRVSSALVQEVEQLQAREERKEKEVIQVRLENIKLKNKIHQYESTLRSKEELTEGLHIIDFEQLKIENQTYNEKIEERNEELLKLRKKITNTVQVLTHLKEKLQFVQAEHQEQRNRLMEVEALVAQKRDILTKTKQARDSLRSDNLKLKQQCGLLGNKILLRDFEDKVDAIEELQKKLETLKRQHAELTLSSKGMIKKIEEARLSLDDQ